jgi:hypothetical protein
MENFKFEVLEVMREDGSKKRKFGVIIQHVMWLAYGQEKLERRSPPSALQITVSGFLYRDGGVS